MKSVFSKPLTDYEVADTWGRLQIATNNAERAAKKQDITETGKFLEDANDLLKQLKRNKVAKSIETS